MVLDELQVNNSTLSSKRLNGCHGMAFECEHINSCHKASNGWYVGLVVPVFSILGLVILHS